MVFPWLLPTGTAQIAYVDASAANMSREDGVAFTATAAANVYTDSNWSLRTASGLASNDSLYEAVPILKQTITGLTPGWYDRWGTPFIVHPLGTGMLELRCAGPDRTAYTKDDLILQPDGVLRHGDADANRGSAEAPGR